jgi:formylglycine-generating enzyme required for sulfatase activity
VIIFGLILIVLSYGARFYWRRWIDPNPFEAIRNPSECPSPSDLRIAFVKVEPPGKPPFCMARYETTRGLYGKVMGKTRSRRKDGGLPAVRISWNDAQRFLAELNRRDSGGRYRLPTGEEWEYAAKGEEENPPVASSGTANCENEEDPDGFERAAPVGSYQPNLLGLYDMLGNASEWVSDSAVPGRKIRRGGGFDNAVRNCSATYESPLDPDNRPNDAGFRIVRDPVKP